MMLYSGGLLALVNVDMSCRYVAQIMEMVDNVGYPFAFFWSQTND